MSGEPEEDGLLDADVTKEIIGAFFEVYNELGSGFSESVYQRAMPIALAERGLLAEREVALHVRFRGHPVGDYRADLIVETRIIVEVKAAEQLVRAHERQLVNYLRATNLRLGLLLNFGPKATFRRLIQTGTMTDPRESRSPDPRRSGVLR